MTEKKNGNIRIYYDETKIKLLSKYFIFNGKQEGEYKSYHWNGQLWVICNYKNGAFEGEYRSYHKNGQLHLICNYKNDKYRGKI